MSIQRLYTEPLPFSWAGKSPEIIQDDRNWLEWIEHNAAPFTDWWTKVRIVQLAHSHPPDAPLKSKSALPTYAGMKSEAEIAATLRAIAGAGQYPAFQKAVTEDYVIDTLNTWFSQQFPETVSRNFEVYVDYNYPNVFLVASTATVSLGVKRQLPPNNRFRPLFNVDELAQIMQQRQVESLTLRTHGYGSPAKGFYENFAQEAKILNTPDPITNARTLQDNQIYVGYDWPSEQPIFSPGLWVDAGRNPRIVFKFWLMIGILSSIGGTLLYIFLKLLEVLNLIVANLVQWYWILPTLFILWGLAFQLLRVTVYQRDINRSINYGAPDLSEFFWRLDRSLSNRQNWLLPPASEAEVQRLSNYSLRVNLIGHSMGALVLVNSLRILTDRYGKDDRGNLAPDFVPVATAAGRHLVARDSTPTGSDTQQQIGKHLELNQLILVAPDLPLELLREGRNNYVRSAMRRCRRIYLMSSDRDIVLRYLSTFGNWFNEPSVQMAGLRLGNVYLKSVQVTGGTPQYRPYIRILVHSESAARPLSAYDLFRKFNYLDCSQMQGEGGGGGVNSVSFRLNRFNGPLIDLINTLLFLLNQKRLDVHGGYFQTNTCSFKILKLLITADTLTDQAIKDKIEQMILGTPIRFLPSYPWTMPSPSFTSPDS